MGRYYNGDIDGKFWFAVQSSNAADRFGSTGYEPSYINYSFDKSHIPTINKELTSIEKQIPIKILDKFFNQVQSYTNEKVADFCESEGFDMPIDKDSTDMLTNFLPIFSTNLIDGLTANQTKLKENIENSPVIVTLLTPKIGYLKSADLFKESLKTGKTIRELVVSKKLMTNKEVSSLLS